MENPSAFPMGEPNDGFAQYFVGQSYLAPVLETPQIAIHNVTFEPGCRNMKRFVKCLFELLTQHRLFFPR